MRFFKWLINFKIKDLTAEEKVIYLANQLVKQYQKAGYDARTVCNQETCGCIDIWIHNYNSEKCFIKVENGNIRESDIRGKLTTKIKKL